MLKRISLLTLFLLLHFSGMQAQGIRFENLSYEQALIKAKAESKMVFLHGFATWCHFCEYMKDSVYPTAEVGNFFNEHFVSIQLDMEKEGREMGRRLASTSYPQLVFFNPDGQIAHRVAGQKSVSTLLQAANEALDPAKQLLGYEQKFKSGTATQDEIAIYFRMLNSAAVEAQPIFNQYFQTLTDSAFVTAPTFRLFNEFFRDTELPAMNRFLQHRKAFVALTSKDSVENRILNNYNSTLMMATQRLDTVKYNRIVNKLRSSGLDMAEKIIAYASLNKRKLKSEYNEYQKEAVPFIEKYGHGDFRRLNEIAYNIYDKGTDPTILSKAESWALESIQLSESYRGYHTLACVSYKLNKKQQALEAANKALEWGKKMNVDVKQTTLLLDKINAMP